MKFSKKNKLRKNSKRKKIKQKNKGGASTEGEISNKIKDIIQSIKYLNRPKENLVENKYAFSLAQKNPESTPHRLPPNKYPEIFNHIGNLEYLVKQLQHLGGINVFIDLLISNIIELNPEVTEEQLREKLVFNEDDSIRHWDLSKLNLVQLPESFGFIQITGDLFLSRNKLSSLPDSFGSISVGRTLYLHNNQLSSLPNSFGSIIVGRSLYLNDNQLTCLPDSFTTNFSVGVHLFLNNNLLKSLPESIYLIQVGSNTDGVLYLNNNLLESLPESIGRIDKNISNLNLSRNQLKKLPDSIGSIKMNGWLSLKNNKLISLPESIYSITLGNYMDLSENNRLNLDLRHKDFPYVSNGVLWN